MNSQNDFWQFDWHCHSDSVIAWVASQYTPAHWKLSCFSFQQPEEAVPPVRSFLKTHKHFSILWKYMCYQIIESKSHYRTVMSLFSSPFKEIPWVIINDKCSVFLIKLEKNNACVYSVCFWKKQNFEGFFSSITQLFNILLRNTFGVLLRICGRGKRGRHGIGDLGVPPHSEGLHLSKSRLVLNLL